MRVFENQLLVSIPKRLCLSKDCPSYSGDINSNVWGDTNSETWRDSQNVFAYWGYVLGLLPLAACQLPKATNIRTASLLGSGVNNRKAVFSGFFCVRNIKKSHQKITSKNASKQTTFLQEAAVAAVSGEDAAEPQEEEGMPSGFGSTSSLPGSHSNGREDSEVARFGAVKEKKHSLENGISVFNRCSHACVS